MPTLGAVEILWWLAPPVVATVLAMLWVSWLGRPGRGEVDRDVAVRRLGEALARPARTPAARPAPRPRERSSGVALRRPTTGVTPAPTPSPGERPEAPPRVRRVVRRPSPEAQPGRSTRRAS